MNKELRPKARVAKGFRDISADEIRGTRQMLATIQQVYEAYGFEPVEQPFIEYTVALGKFLQTLEERPEIAEGYALFIYPLCNPTGFEDGTRHSRAGVDLNREFWKQTCHPEVRFLESEIWMQAFHGIITLHSDDTSQGLYGFVKGSVLSEHLLQPALLEAGRYLPRNHGAVIDGFNARSGIIHSGYPGMLQSIPGMVRPPFEITLETPQKASLHRQVDALVAALQTILVENRYLQAIAQNI